MIRLGKIAIDLIYKLLESQQKAMLLLAESNRGLNSQISAINNTLINANSNIMPMIMQYAGSFTAQSQKCCNDEIDIDEKDLEKQLQDYIKSKFKDTFAPMNKHDGGPSTTVNTAPESRQTNDYLGQNNEN